jgi:hypothetical protein
MGLQAMARSNPPCACKKAFDMTFYSQDEAESQLCNEEKAG